MVAELVDPLKRRLSLYLLCPLGSLCVQTQLEVVKELTAYVKSFTVDMSVAGGLTEGGGLAVTLEKVRNMTNGLRITMKSMTFVRVLAILEWFSAFHAATR